MWTIIWNGGEITLVNQKEGLEAIKAELFCLLSGIAARSWLPANAANGCWYACVKSQVKQDAGMQLYRKPGNAR